MVNLIVLFEVFIMPFGSMGFHITKYLKGITGVFIRESNCTCCGYAKESSHGDCSFEHPKPNG